MTISTVIFDLDDTLLWDKKSIATAFALTCQKAASIVHVDAKQLEEKGKEMNLSIRLQREDIFEAMHRV